MGFVIGDLVFWKTYYGEIKSGRVDEIDEEGWLRIGDNNIFHKRAFRTREEALAFNPIKKTRRMVEKV